MTRKRKLGYKAAWREVARLWLGPETAPIAICLAALKAVGA